MQITVESPGYMDVLAFYSFSGKNLISRCQRKAIFHFPCRPVYMHIDMLRVDHLNICRPLQTLIYKKKRNRKDMRDVSTLFVCSRHRQYELNFNFFNSWTATHPSSLIKATPSRGRNTNYINRLSVILMSNI